MFKNWTPWIGLSILFILSLVFVSQNYGKAFPLVHVNITMDRHQALAAATALKDRHRWGPAIPRHAQSFDLDDHARDFIELEAGGHDAFVGVIESGIWSPYTWRVRFFQEGEINETLVLFTPAGTPCGFNEKLSEKAPGAALPEDEARAIAENAASHDWAIDLSTYSEVEVSHDERPGGRVDYAFTYERKADRIGEGRYRLRVSVSGDRCTGIMPFLKVPESFDRRYEQMRSANNSIATASNVVIIVLYFGAGCLIGLIFLLRSRFLLWKPAILAAAIVAVLESLTVPNSLPLAWMSYDTAQSASVFVAQMVTQVLTGFLWSMLEVGLSFMVAESLTRRAFPSSLQLWKAWAPGTASSREVTAQTVFGFLWVGISLAYQAGVYLAGNRWLGWWSPSDSLVDPNILGMVVPWFTPAAQALHAGFWEECLFRAVPLAYAAMLGRRIGRPRLVVGIALVLQAVVFGAAHANYPNQPAYARIAEITPEFLIYGLVYLRYGLLPCIVAHYGFDMVLMSAPLFFTQTPGIWIDRSIAVTLLLVPLIVVFAAAARRRCWTPLDPAVLNSGWTPCQPSTTPSASQSNPMEASPPDLIPLSRRQLISAAIALAAGLALWIAFHDFRNLGGRLSLSRSEALRQATPALASFGMEPTGRWDAATSIMDAGGTAGDFVWREHGESSYRELQALAHLSVPAWHVQFRRFDPSLDVAEKAEIYGVSLVGTGDVLSVYHILPEARPGRTDTESDARATAGEFIASRMGINTNELKEISILPSKRPSRTDWSLTSAYTNRAGFTNNEVRVSVSMTDGSINNYSRFIHIPEDWMRREQARTARLSIVTSICSIAITLFSFAGLVIGIILWARGRFNSSLFWRLLPLMAIPGILVFANNWPTTVAGFSTAQPWASQLGTTLAWQLMQTALFAPIFALLGTAGKTLQTAPDGWGRRLLAGLTLGAAATGILSLARIWEPDWSPPILSCQPLNALVPFLDPTLEMLRTFLARTAFLGFLFWLINRFGRCRPASVLLRFSVFQLIALALVGRGGITNFLPWLLSACLLGVTLTAANELLLRRRPYLLPIAYASLMSLSILSQIPGNPYPGSIPASCFAAFCVLLTACLLTRWWTSVGHVNRMDEPPPQA